jgi:hypothetical protein
MERSHHFHIEHRPWADGFGLHLAMDVPDRAKIAIARTINIETADRGSCLTEPLIELSRDDAQGLFNELWRAGLRPTTEIGSEGERVALKNHIADLQKVVDRVLPAVPVKKNNLDLPTAADF